MLSLRHAYYRITNRLCKILVKNTFTCLTRMLSAKDTSFTYKRTGQQL